MKFIKIICLLALGLQLVACSDEPKLINETDREQMGIIGSMNFISNYMSTSLMQSQFSHGDVAKYYPVKFKAVEENGLSEIKNKCLNESRPINLLNVEVEAEEASRSKEGRVVVQSSDKCPVDSFAYAEILRDSGNKKIQKKFFSDTKFTEESYADEKYFGLSRIVSENIYTTDLGNYTLGSGYNSLISFENGIVFTARHKAEFEPQSEGKNYNFSIHSKYMFKNSSSRVEHEISISAELVKDSDGKVYSYFKSGTFNGREFSYEDYKLLKLDINKFLESSY